MARWRHLDDVRASVAIPGIVLQKSKVAAPRIFRENKKRKAIADSYTLNRVAKLAGEFNVRGAVPSHLYTKDAPTARRIFDHLCKTTFATQSRVYPTSGRPARKDVIDPKRSKLRGVVKEFSIANKGPGKVFLVGSSDTHPTDILFAV